MFTKREVTTGLVMVVMAMEAIVALTAIGFYISGASLGETGSWLANAVAAIALAAVEIATFYRVADESGRRYRWVCMVVGIVIVVGFIAPGILLGERSPAGNTPIMLLTVVTIIARAVVLCSLLWWLYSRPADG